jgi:Tfp pilus assembly protein FimT
MNNAIMAVAALIAIPVIRQALKSYRAKKSIGNIVADSVEAAVDIVDKK